MVRLWRGDDRGSTRRAGFHRHHQFASGSYFEPERLGFGELRVLDEACLAGAASLESERRANMEILTWMIDGEVELAIGDKTHVLRKGGLACVSAGSGVDCAIRNRGEGLVRMMQLWLQPMVVNAVPRSAVRQYLDAELRHEFRVVATGARTAAESPLRLDANVCVARADSGERLRYPLSARRRAWLQVLRGSVECGETTACAGDAIEICDEEFIDLRVREDGEFLLVDLACLKPASRNSSALTNA